MSSYHCEKCRSIAQKKHPQKVDLRFKEDYIEPLVIKKKENVIKAEKSVSKVDTPTHAVKGAAILAKVDTDIDLRDKIVFTTGIGNNKSFKVSEDGSRFIFTQPGLYRIVFNGKINVPGKIVLNRIPEVSESQNNFAKYSFGGEIQSVSTMLPFKSGNQLSIQFISSVHGKNVVLESGSQIEIYKVDEL